MYLQNQKNRFEEFGESTPVFKVLYRIDATQIRRERMDSDLCLMVDKALNEAGITLAFPQRDIHCDSSQPLQVQVASVPVKPETESTKRPLSRMPNKNITGYSSRHFVQVEQGVNDVTV